jgi:hypothetical protein
MSKKTPSWLFHAHYGPEATPLTVYDNHDGTFAMYDNMFKYSKLKPEKALRLFTRKMNELALNKTQLHG